MSDATNVDPTEILDDPQLPVQTATNDAVAGETIIATDHYAGATGSEPREAQPRFTRLDDEDVDLEQTLPL